MNETSEFLVGHAELIIFLAIFAEQLGVPLPAAPVLVAAGALAAEGVLNPVLALGVTIVACLLADLVWFYVGRRGGDGLPRILSRLPLCNASSFGRTERFFARYGMSAVAGAKFIPGFGFLLPALSGALGIKAGKFLKFDLLGSIFYGIFYLELGLLFSHELSGFLELIGQFALVLLAVAVALLLILAAGRYSQRRKAMAPPSEPASRVLTTIAET
jgi:membrane protein DedA with SNARE-associated domain